MASAVGYTQEQIARYDAYRALLEEHSETLGPHGDTMLGEIQLAVDNGDMAAAEEASGKKVGVQYKNNFWTVLHDPVAMHERMDVLSRIVPNALLDGTGSHVASVAVLPILDETHVVLLSTYKHTTRHWHVEMIRGHRTEGQSDKEVVSKEALEEAGVTVESIERVGKIALETDFVAGRTGLYTGKVVEVSFGEDKEEVIEGIVVLSFAEIAKLFLSQGKPVECEVIRGNRTVKRDLVCDDPCLASALFIMGVKASEKMAAQTFSAGASRVSSGGGSVGSSATSPVAMPPVAEDDDNVFTE